MKILYVILTCQKYLSTRCEWQKKTWLKDVEADPQSDYVLLCAAPDPSNSHIFGCNTHDDYSSCPYKYHNFILNNKLDNYDFVFFCDDDTFVYHDRLVKLLDNYDPKESYLLGQWLQHEKDFIVMSGGAGFAISNELYKKIYNLIISTKELPFYLSSDVTIGKWINLIGNFKWKDLNDILNSKNRKLPAHRQRHAPHDRPSSGSP